MIIIIKVSSLAILIDSIHEDISFAMKRFVFELCELLN